MAHPFSHALQSLTALVEHSANPTSYTTPVADVMALINSSTDTLLQLRHTHTPSQQIGLLKRLKNDLIGHPVRKQECVQQGVVLLLADLLRSRGESSRKSSCTGPALRMKHGHLFNPEDAVFLCAVDIATIILNGTME